MRLLFALLFAALASAGALNASPEAVGTTGANFLKIAPPARQAALGEAGGALAGDDSGLSYNPAGGATLLRHRLSATHIEWLQGVQLEDLRGAFFLGRLGTLSLGLRWLQFGSLVRTERVASGADAALNYRVTGEFNPYDAAYSLGYAHYLGSPAFSLGLNLHGVQQSVDQMTGWAVSGDLGFQAYGILPGLDLGLYARGLGTQIKVARATTDLAAEPGAGLAWRLPWWPLTLSADLSQPSDDGLSWGGGAEARFWRAFSARGGYRSTDGRGRFSAGFGVLVADLGIDYAWVPYQDLGQTHRVSASYAFGSPPIGLDLDRPLIGPVGDADKREANFLPKLPMGAVVSRWQLQILHATGKEKLLSGEGALPAKLPWAGRDLDGRVLPDQKVRGKLTVEFEDGGRSSALSKELELDSTPPLIAFNGEPKVHRPGQDVALSVPATFSLAADDRHLVNGWIVEIRTPDGELFRNYGAKLSPPAKLLWDGKSNTGMPVRSGSAYICRFFARDTLGNWARSPAEAQIVLLREVQLILSSDTLFNSGEIELPERSYAEMGRVRDQINTYLAAGQKVRVIGHTDNTPVGSGRYSSNIEISVSRAQNVANALVSRFGMDPSLFIVEGKGEFEPVADNSTQEGRDLNRRVQIIIPGVYYQ